MDKNEIAALLDTLCERPFAGGRDGEPPAVPAFPGHAARTLAGAEGSAGAPEAEATAALASILSGTASEAQCQRFQEAALASGAVRLEAQSALAFVDGLEQAPLKAPARLVEEALAPSGGAPARAQPGIWSRLARSRVGGRRGQLAAACAVMLMAGGLSWSLLWRPADFAADPVPVPMGTSPGAGSPINAIEAKPVPPPAATPLLRVAPGPPASPASTIAPLSAPPLPMSPAPVPAPPAQALAEPCAPRSFQTSEAGPRSKVEAKVAKRAPSQQTKTAAVTAPDPGCAVNGVGAFEADQGPVRAARPAVEIGASDPAAAAASAPAAAARPASPAKRPSAVEQRR